MMRRFVLILLCVYGIIAFAQEPEKQPAEAPDLKLAPLFTENMVLQRGIKVPVWGQAAANEDISIKIAGQTKKTKANSSGKWRIELDPMPAGGPFELNVNAGEKSKIELKNVLVGDVWICSGQSNMGFGVNQLKDSAQEIAAASHPNIRLFKVPGQNAAEPQTEMKSKTWDICTPRTVGTFSAVAYYFGRNLHKELNVPIGLIHVAVGGSPILPWIPLTSLENNPDFAMMSGTFKETIKVYPQKKKEYDEAMVAWTEKKKQLSKEEAQKLPGPPAPELPPSSYYNAMLNPLIPYAIKGTIWYQGESDVKRAVSYRKLLTALINGWREKWGQGDFPFLIVQLPNFYKPQEKPGDAIWAEMREAQAMALKLPATGLAVTIDIGDENNIHPLNKQDVGTRLALVGLHVAYGKKNVCYGPTYKSMKIDGDKARIEFDNIASGLLAKDGDLKCFAIAGEDKKFTWADARIEGNSVIVSSPVVQKPVAVRYAWANNPAGCNLYNKEGLPTAPFRTDTWALTTENAK